MIPCNWENEKSYSVMLQIESSKVRYKLLQVYTYSVFCRRLNMEVDCNHLRSCYCKTAPLCCALIDMWGNDKKGEVETRMFEMGGVFEHPSIIRWWWSIWFYSEHTVTMTSESQITFNTNSPAIFIVNDATLYLGEGKCYSEMKYSVLYIWESRKECHYIRQLQQSAAILLVPAVFWHWLLTRIQTVIYEYVWRVWDGYLEVRELHEHNKFYCQTICTKWWIRTFLCRDKKAHKVPNYSRNEGNYCTTMTLWGKCRHK